MTSKVLFSALFLIACSSFIAGKDKPLKSVTNGEFIEIDNSNLDTLTLFFSGSYNYDYYRIFLNGFLFNHGLLYSMDGTERPHKSVEMVYDKTVEIRGNIKVEVNRRSEELSGSYSPLWGEMDINNTVFKNPPFKAELALDTIGENRIFKISNRAGKLSITPIIKREIDD